MGTPIINNKFFESMNLQLSSRLTYALDLLKELIARDIKVTYKHSILGFAWSLLNPLLYLLVFYFIFRMIMSIDIPRYSSYVFCGLLIYTWFQISLFQAAVTITGNAELVRRPGFPVAILPIVTVLTNLIHFILSLPVLGLFLVIEKSDIGITIFTLPLLILIQFVLTLGLAYLVASVNVIFRDTQHLLSVILQLFLFLSPIFYDVKRIPERFLTYYKLNPLVPLIDAYRSVLIEGIQPDWMALSFTCTMAVFFLIVGYKIFVWLKYRFVEEL